MSDRRRPVRVLLAEGEFPVRARFRQAIEAGDDIEIVGEADNGRDAVASARALRPDVVVMDMRLPRLDGIAATRAIATTPELHRVRSLLLVTRAVDVFVYAALRAGASGFLTKDCEPETLLAAVRVVATGEALVEPAQTRQLIARFNTVRPDQPVPEQRLAPLALHEREIVAMVGQGLSNAEIADGLGIAAATVRVQVNHAMATLGARDRVHLVVFAHQTGLATAGTGSG